MLVTDTTAATLKTAFLLSFMGSWTLRRRFRRSQKQTWTLRLIGRKIGKLPWIQTPPCLVPTTSTTLIKCSTFNCHQGVALTLGLYATVHTEAGVLGYAGAAILCCVISLVSHADVYPACLRRRTSGCTPWCVPSHYDGCALSGLGPSRASLIAGPLLTRTFLRSICVARLPVSAVAYFF